MDIFKDRGTQESSQTVWKAQLEYVQKRQYYQKGPSKRPLDSRYPFMPEPTGGLGVPLTLRHTGILSSNTCPGNSNIPEYAYISPTSQPTKQTRQTRI